jgi:hypothetical protein
MPPELHRESPRKGKMNCHLFQGDARWTNVVSRAGFLWSQRRGRIERIRAARSSGIRWFRSVSEDDLIPTDRLPSQLQVLRSLKIEQDAAVD